MNNIETDSGKRSSFDDLRHSEAFAVKGKFYLSF